MAVPKAKRDLTSRLIGTLLGTMIPTRVARRGCPQVMEPTPVKAAVVAVLAIKAATPGRCLIMKTTNATAVPAAAAGARPRMARAISPLPAVPQQAATAKPSSAGTAARTLLNSYFGEMHFRSSASRLGSLCLRVKEKGEPKLVVYILNFTYLCKKVRYV